MLKEMKAILYYLAVDMRFSFIVFWSILLASITVLFIVVLSFDTNMVLSTSMAIYIFCGITGFLTTKETFPYCIKLGATRNQYLLSILVYGAVVAFVFSLIHVIVQQIFSKLVELGPSERFITYHTVDATTLSNTWYNQLIVDGIVCFLLLSVGFLLGTIFYRLGLIGGLGTLAFIALLLIVPYTRNTLVDAFFSFDTIISGEEVKVSLNFLLLVLVSLAAYLPNWGLLRKASTVSNAVR
jgi:hypothetical protein